MKILVVDDEKTIVKGIKFNLENEGYEVDACYDGEAAVELARSGDYAVILLDLMMPKVDGLEACQQIRQFRRVSQRCQRSGQPVSGLRPDSLIGCHGFPPPPLKCFPYPVT